MLLAHLQAGLHRPAEVAQVLQRLSQVDPAAAQQLQMQLQGALPGAPGFKPPGSAVGDAARKLFGWLNAGS
jgi:hypothetical protein